MYYPSKLKNYRLLEGSGGSVVTNRLTENPEWSVLLLEAGNDENFFSDIPLTAALQSVTALNWGYKSEKMDTACLGLVDGRCNMARGKALGGTSVINFMLYTRGHGFVTSLSHSTIFDYLYKTIITIKGTNNCLTPQGIFGKFTSFCANFNEISMLTICFATFH